MPVEKLQVKKQTEERQLELFGLEFHKCPAHQLATCIAFDLALKPPPASVREL